MKQQFTKISYEQFERLRGPSHDYEESAIDGYEVIAAYDQDDCIGIWYSVADMGTSCPGFMGDMIDYSEQDPFYPYN